MAGDVLQRSHRDLTTQWHVHRLQQGTAVYQRHHGIICRVHNIPHVKHAQFATVLGDAEDAARGQVIHCVE